MTHCPDLALILLCRCPAAGPLSFADMGAFERVETSGTVMRCQQSQDNLPKLI